MNDYIPSLISTIEKIKSVGKFNQYIDFIHFPFYRNIALDTRINFDFPLTIFLGQNGCGKSSALHALYGAPKDKTPYEFWFDTKVDPIEYYNDEKKRHSFWYSFKSDNGENVEVVKARIKREDDPNYWETSRPLKWAGMVSKTRSSPLTKNVIYLDFRSELSAFDKFFYFGNTKNIKARNRQEFIRRKSAHLKKLFDEKTDYVIARKVRQNKELKKLTEEELSAISFILGKKYVSGKSVFHSLFRNQGYSVLFNTDFAQYSEAFAGSGEMSIVRLVTEVISAPDYSLILLDEPEVSLHPGAQHRLKCFLLEQIVKKKHQIIMTSHSPVMVKDMPDTAIKVFYQNPNDGRFIVKENLSYHEAFFHIQFRDDADKKIYIEDKVAEKIISGLVSKEKPEALEYLKTIYNPGGVGVIKKEFISVFCRNSNKTDFVIFDGDQKKVKNHLDYRSLPINETTIARLQQEIKAQSQVDIKFSIDGGGGKKRDDQQLNLLKDYLDFYLTNVFYLPKEIPEEIIWDDELAESLLKVQSSDTNFMMNIILNEQDYKERFHILTQTVWGNNDQMDSCIELFIQKWLLKKDANYQALISIIDTIIKA